MALTDNLLGYWKLDNNSTDSLWTYNWTDTNVSYDANGKIWYCDYNSTASPTQYITTGLTATIRSVSFWMKWLAWWFSPVGNNTAERWDVVHQTSNASNWFFIRRFWNSSNLSYNLWWDFYWNNNSSNGLFDWTWHHFVMTTNGTNTYLYTDWALTYTHTSKTRTTAWAFKMAWTPYGDRHFWWYLDEVGTRSTQLSLADVQALYNWWAGLTYPFASAVTGNMLLMF